MRTISIEVTVPNDYDTGPVLHRIEQIFEGIITGSSETDPVIEPELQCPVLEYDIIIGDPQ